MDAVGFALVGLVLAAAIQWLVEAKHHSDLSAWHRVEAMWGYPFLGLVALTVLFLLGHFCHACREVFVAHQDRADTAEGSLDAVTAERDLHRAERDEHAHERDQALARVAAAEGRVQIETLKIERLEVHGDPGAPKNVQRAVLESLTTVVEQPPGTTPEPQPPSEGSGQGRPGTA
jgi:hypothetical protein